MDRAERIIRTQRKVKQRVALMKKMAVYEPLNDWEIFGRDFHYHRSYRHAMREVLRMRRMDKRWKSRVEHNARNYLPIGRCGCPSCRWEAYMQRLDRRRKRHNEHMRLKHLMEEINGKNRISL